MYAQMYKSFNYIQMWHILEMNFTIKIAVVSVGTCQTVKLAPLVWLWAIDKPNQIGQRSSTKRHAIRTTVKESPSILNLEEVSPHQHKSWF